MCGQPPRLAGENLRKGLEGERCIQQVAVGRERESDPSGHHSMHHRVLHCPRSGTHILCEIFYEIPPSFVFCDIRKGRRRTALEELMQQHSEGQTDAVDDASRMLLNPVGNQNLCAIALSTNRSFAALWLRNPSPHYHPSPTSNPYPRIRQLADQNLRFLPTQPHRSKPRPAITLELPITNIVPSAYLDTCTSAKIEIRATCTRTQGLKRGKHGVLSTPAWSVYGSGSGA